MNNSEGKQGLNVSIILNNSSNPINALWALAELFCPALPSKVPFGNSSREPGKTVQAWRVGTGILRDGVSGWKTILECRGGFRGQLCDGFPGTQPQEPDPELG